MSKIQTDFAKDKANTGNSNRPIAVNVEKGKQYLWCTCGKTGAPPLCDGSHQGSEHRPLIYQASDTKTEYFCGCAGTGNPPFCDGTHQFSHGGGRDDYYDRYC